MRLLFFTKQASGGNSIELPLFVDVSESPVDMQQDYKMFNTLPETGLQKLVLCSSVMVFFYKGNVLGSGT
jgi:hypothetical protein